MVLVMMAAVAVVSSVLLASEWLLLVRRLPTGCSPQDAQPGLLIDLLCICPALRLHQITTGAFSSMLNISACSCVSLLLVPL